MTTVATLREQLAQRGIKPATLQLEEAAAYVGMSKRTFLREVQAGNMPKPLELRGRRKLFSIAALDQRINPQQAPQRSMRDEIDEALESYVP